jgi:hypothetical protein
MSDESLGLPEYQLSMFRLLADELEGATPVMQGRIIEEIRYVCDRAVYVLNGEVNIVARPTDSANLRQQMAGRALRPTPDTVSENSVHYVPRTNVYTKEDRAFAKSGMGRKLGYIEIAIAAAERSGEPWSVEIWKHSKADPRTVLINTRSNSSGVDIPLIVERLAELITKHVDCNTSVRVAFWCVDDENADLAVDPVFTVDDLPRGGSDAE